MDKVHFNVCDIFIYYTMRNYTLHVSGQVNLNKPHHPNWPTSPPQKWTLKEHYVVFKKKFDAYRMNEVAVQILL